jgi:hypothetical protein
MSSSAAESIVLRSDEEYEGSQTAIKSTFPTGVLLGTRMRQAPVVERATAPSGFAPDSA